MTTISFRWLRLAFISAVFFFSCHDLWAVQTVVTMKAGLTVYTGPGKRFRPVTKLENHAEVRAADEIVTGEDGRYYKVLVNVDGKRQAIGFLPVSDKVKTKPAGASEEDIANYPEVALARRTVSSSVFLLSGNREMGNIGYTYYVTPGFYVKGIAGVFFDPDSIASIFGGEMGNDAIIWGRWSAFVWASGGVFMPNHPGKIFAGSAGINEVVTGAIGLRYNGPGWSVGSGFSQLVLFNADNSLVLFGPMATVEASL